MNKLAITLTSLLTTLSIAQAAPTDVVGQWEISARYCTDGLPAQDAFVIGRDKMKLLISASEINSIVDFVEQGKSYNNNSSYTIDDNYIYSNQTGKTQATAYFLSNSNELSLITGGFGKGGTCNEGQALIIKFMRK